MPIDNVVGIDCKAYYSTGSYTTPVWVEIDQIETLNATMDKNTAEGKCRAYKTTFYGEGTKVIGVTFNYLREGTAANDTVFDALEGMYWSGGAKDMAFVDGAIATTDTRGLRGHFICDSMSETQELEGMLMNEFSFKPVRFNDGSGVRVPEHWEAA